MHCIAWWPQFKYAELKAKKMLALQGRTEMMMCTS